MRAFTFIGLLGLVAICAVYAEPAFRYRTGQENTVGMTLEQQKAWWANPTLPAPGKATDGPTGPLQEWAAPKK